jgi:hypothetical protein
MLLVRQPSPKGRGHMLDTKKVSCGRFDLEAGRSMARTVRGGGTDGPRVRRVS